MSSLGRALPHDSVLHRRNPTVKLAVFLVVSVVVLVPVDPWTPLVLLVLAAPAVVRAGRIPWRRSARAALLFGPFALSLLAVNAVTRDGPVVAEVARAGGDPHGPGDRAALALRTVLVGTLAVAFSLTTDGARLMTSLHQHARLGARPTFAVLAGYRVLEDLPERWTTIRQAQSVRDPRRCAEAPCPRDAGSLARAAFTLLVVALRQGERMAIAMETRGLGSGPRTVHRPVALDRRDAAFAALVLGVCLLVVLVSWRIRGAPDVGDGLTARARDPAVPSSTDGIRGRGRAGVRRGPGRATARRRPGASAPGTTTPCTTPGWPPGGCAPPCPSTARCWTARSPIRCATSWPSSGTCSAPPGTPTSSGHALRRRLAHEDPALVVGPVEQRIDEDRTAARLAAQDRLDAWLASARFARARRDARPGPAGGSPGGPGRPPRSCRAAPAARGTASTARWRSAAAAAAGRGPRRGDARGPQGGAARPVRQRGRRAGRGRPAARRSAARAHRVQEVLGTQHDAVTRQETLRRLAHQAELDGESTFTYGRLHALEQRGRAEAEQDAAARPAAAGGPARAPRAGRASRAGVLARAVVVPEALQEPRAVARQLGLVRGRPRAVGRAGERVVGEPRVRRHLGDAEVGDRQVGDRPAALHLGDHQRRVAARERVDHPAVVAQPDRVPRLGDAGAAAADQLDARRRRRARARPRSGCPRSSAPSP